MFKLFQTALIASIAIFVTLPALADQIDGDWCSNDGQHLTISGSNITIPSGARITGTYGHHTFTYTGPADDPEAGQDIRMVQRSEEQMYLTRSSNPDIQEEWKRCQVIS